jgi:putative ABC transport system permease protein
MNLSRDSPVKLRKVRGGFDGLAAALFFGVEPADPATYAAVAVFICLVGLVACYAPARRATRVDPIVVLRQE